MNRRLPYLAAILALVSVVLMAWSVLDASPVAVVLGMTIGQIVGTIALGLLLTAIVVELRRVGLLARARAPTADDARATPSATPPPIRSSMPTEP